MAYEQNTRTLIATFNDYGTARQAARDLQDSGIPAENVHVDSNQKTAGAGSGGYQYEERQEEKHSSFGEWWRSIFGGEEGDQERHGYERALSSGGTILRATVPEASVSSAVDILNRHGARDIDSQQAEFRGTGEGPIEVVEEQLQVGKRAVRRGGVRIYSHVVTEPVEEQVRLREEHVNVERRKVDREVRPEEISALRDQTIEVTEMAEEAVIGKRARVREEVVVGKEASEQTETVRDNLRHTEVEIEKLGSEGKSSASNRPTASKAGVNTKRDLSVNQPSPGVMSGSGTTAGTGTLAGEATAGSAVRDFPSGTASQDFTADYRRNFEENYGTGSSFETMRPAYEYGYRNAGDPRYRGKVWDEVENDLRTDYERTNPGSRWEQAKGAVRYGWEKVTGKR
jgi:uncharacterized protein (TIGR02271 family)